MTSVILFGIAGGFINDEIAEILAPYGITEVRNSYLNSNSDNPSFLLLECSARIKAHADSGIIVMLGEAAGNSYIDIPDGFKGIVNSNDTTALEILSKSDIKTVSCGMFGNETVILTSFTDTSACISLQRRVTTLNGKTVEPFEYPIKLQKSYSEYAIMAAFSILLLSDNLPDKW